MPRMRSSSTPRVAGRRLRLAARLLASGAAGPIRRHLAAELVERKLAGVDLAAEGEPAPLYLPPRFRR
jgi:hypothetical protein